MYPLFNLITRELQIGFGWANSLMVLDISGPNAAAVQNAVTICAQDIKSKSESGSGK
jgi:hypothetical protein